MDNNQLARQLEQEWGGQIAADDDSRNSYRHDAGLFEIKPALIAYPKTIAEIGSLISWTKKQRQAEVAVSLTARGRGTGLSGGSLNSHIIVDLSRYLNNIGQINSHQQIEVEAGARFKLIALAAAEQNLMFAAYPASWELCSIGGMLGNNASGEKSIRWGSTADNVNQVEVVLADGQNYWFGPLNPDQLAEKCRQTNFEGYIYQTVRGLLEANQGLLERSRPQVRKNCAGYNLWQIWDQSQQYFNLTPLFIGSQGTLGLISQAKLELVSQINSVQLLVIGLDKLSQLTQVVNLVLNHNPEGFEVYDQTIAQLAQQLMPEISDKAQDLGDHQLILLAQFAEVNQTRTESVARVVLAELEKLQIPTAYITDPDSHNGYWQTRRAALSLLLGHGQDNFRACPFLEDAVVSPGHFGDFINAFEAILSDYDINYSCYGNVGEGSLKIVPFLDLSLDKSIHLMKDLSRRFYDLVVAFGGSISADHNDGLVRSPYLELMYGSKIMALLTQIKQTFDPDGIFNPNKKTQANLDFSMAQISRSNRAPKLASANL